MLEYDAKHNITKVECFFAEFTPIWFNVLGWVALMAGIQVLNSKPKNLFISGVLGFSLVCLLLYFMALFGRFRFVATEGTTRRHAAKRIQGHRERRFILKVGSVAACGIFVVADLSYFVPSFPWASLLGLGLVFGFALTRHRHRQIQREDAPIA